MLRAKIGENIARKIVSMPNATCSFMTWKGRMSIPRGISQHHQRRLNKKLAFDKTILLFFIVGVVLHGEFVCRQP